MTPCGARSFNPFKNNYEGHALTLNEFLWQLKMHYMCIDNQSFVYNQYKNYFESNLPLYFK